MTSNLSWSGRSHSALKSQGKQVQRSMWSSPVFSWCRTQSSLSFLRPGHPLSKLPCLFWRRTIPVVHHRLPCQPEGLRDTPGVSGPSQVLLRSSRGYRDADGWRWQPAHRGFVSSVTLTSSLPLGNTGKKPCAIHYDEKAEFSRVK